jgi:D-alanine-D-alanine ligase
LRIGVTFNVRLASNLRQPEAFGASDAGDPSIADVEGAGLPARDDVDEEFDAPETIAAMASALAGLGHEVELLGYGEPLVRRLLNGPKLDLVWNIAEGHGSGRSREARVPALLEMLDVPYTCSDPLTLAATLDKDCAKRLVAASGLATPAWALFEGNWSSVREQVARLAFPVFVKPAYEGSSKGILPGSLVDSPAQLKPLLARLHEAYRQPVLVEEFIDGDELTVGIVGNRTPEVIGIMRVLPRVPSPGPFVYDLEVKRDWQRRIRYECPAALRSEDTETVRAAALACWRALGCRDVARVDFRLRRGVPYFLEANPLPGMSPISGDLVIMAGQMGIEYSQLIARVLNAACERLNLVGETSLVS